MRCNSQEDVEFHKMYKKTKGNDPNFLQRKINPLTIDNPGQTLKKVKMCCCAANSSYHSEN